MQIRPLLLSDLEQINEIWERCHKGHFGIPERKHLVTDIVAEGDGKVKAYGITRHFTEALLYLDKDMSQFQQAKAFKLLMEYCIDECKMYGTDQLNVAIENKSFAEILRKRYKFKDRDPVLFLEF